MDDTKKNQTDQNTGVSDNQIVSKSATQTEEIPVLPKQQPKQDVAESADKADTTDSSDITEAVENPVANEVETAETTEKADLADSADTADAQNIDSPTSKPEIPGARWYVVHTYSGHENKVSHTLKQRIESEHLEDKILDVLVPTQDKIEIKGGKKVSVKEKIFPGYILVKMVLDDTSWLAVRTTQGVTSFVGMGNKPTPISEAEVATIVKFTLEEAPVFKQVFVSDDTVKIIDGPFADFIGKVDSVDEEKGKVKILVSIFGRETPVELDFLQVQKI